MRKYYPVAALLILLAAIALSASIVTTSANALPTFTKAEKGIGPCDTCHGQAATHANPNHATLACNKCHLTSTGTPPTPAACAACHGGTSAILATANHAAQGCGTTPGCHGVPVPTPITTAVSLKVAPTSIKFKKTVKATGTVTPAADLVGINVVRQGRDQGRLCLEGREDRQGDRECHRRLQLDLQARQEGHVPHDGLDRRDRRLQGVEVPDQALQGQVTN